MGKKPAKIGAVKPIVSPPGCRGACDPIEYVAEIRKRVDLEFSSGVPNEDHRVDNWKGGPEQLITDRGSA
jgi:hypothetical protein